MYFNIIIVVINFISIMTQFMEMCFCRHQRSDFFDLFISIL